MRMRAQDELQESGVSSCKERVCGESRIRTVNIGHLRSKNLAGLRCNMKDSRDLEESRGLFIVYSFDPTVHSELGLRSTRALEISRPEAYRRYIRRYNAVSLVHLHLHEAVNVRPCLEGKKRSSLFTIRPLCFSADVFFPYKYHLQVVIPSLQYPKKSNR